MYNSIMDEIHRFEILGGLYALKEMNIEYYQVINEDHNKACEKCKALHRVKQKVSEAVEGEDLPLIHPNCRCTIGSYVDNKNVIRSLLNLVPKLKDFINTILSLPSYNKGYKNFLVSLLKQVELINIDGKSYVRLPDFQKNVF